MTIKIDAKAMETAIVKAEMERVEKELRQLVIYSDPLVARIFKLYQEEVERRQLARESLREKIVISAVFMFIVYVMVKVSGVVR